MKSLYWVSGKSCFVGLNLSGFVTNWTFDHYGGICHTFLVFDIEFLGLDWVNLIPQKILLSGVGFYWIEFQDYWMESWMLLSLQVYSFASKTSSIFELG